MRWVVLILALLWSGDAWAQPKQVITTCGSPTLQVGDGNNGYMDINGKDCVNATVTETTTTTATAAATPPTVAPGPNAPLVVNLSSALYVQETFAGTPVDGTHGLPVNCIVGCAGGASSNASDAVATSSTNGQTLAWLYGFNGTTWDRLIVDASKNLKVNVATGSINLALVNTAPATQNVTAQDAATTSTTVANGQIFLTGTPTTNSAAVFALTNGQGTMRVQVTGTWTGTLNTEVSMDGGVTYVAKSMHQIGTAYTIGAYTANFVAEGTIEGVTTIRIRATNAWTGTATIKIIQSVMPEQFYIGNPMRMQDSTNQSVTDTIKPASTAALTTDPAIVVAVSPNNAVASTVANGADVALGTTTDTPCTSPATSTACTLIATAKATLNAIGSAIAAGNNIIGGVFASLGTTNGWTPLSFPALTNTVVNIGSAAAHQMGMLHCYNPNATVAYVQVFNLASGSVTLGSTPPTQSYGIAPTSSGGFALSNPGITFSASLSFAATASATNATSPGTALDCNVVYN